jgi:hypothetical protein
MPNSTTRPNKFQEQVLAGVADIGGALNRELPISRPTIYV